MKKVILVLLLIVIVISLGIIAFKAAQETRSSPEIPDEKYLITQAIIAYINESDDVYLKFGKDQKCTEVRDLFNSLIFNQPKLNKKTYGPYINMKMINKSIHENRLDSYLRNKEMREKNLWWKITIYKSTGSCYVEYSNRNEILYY